MPLYWSELTRVTFSIIYSTHPHNDKCDIRTKKKSLMYRRNKKRHIKQKVTPTKNLMLSNQIVRSVDSLVYAIFNHTFESLDSFINYLSFNMLKVQELYLCRFLSHCWCSCKFMFELVPCCNWIFQYRVDWVALGVWNIFSDKTSFFVVGIFKTIQLFVYRIDNGLVHNSCLVLDLLKCCIWSNTFVGNQIPDSVHQQQRFHLAAPSCIVFFLSANLMLFSIDLSPLVGRL